VDITYRNTQLKSVVRRRYYELTDRLFRIWMQMREGGAGQQKLRLLTEFFQRWYDTPPESLEHEAARVATASLEELRRLGFLGGIPAEHQDPWRVNETSDAYHPEKIFMPQVLESLLTLRAAGNPLSSGAEAWLASLRLEPAALAREFAALMPRLARSEELRPHVLGVYRSLKKLGLMPDDLPPYSAATAAQDASEPDKVLMALTPELREAVSLLLAPGGKQPKG
jgi:hypothetical protein